MAREAFADPNHIVTENYHFEDEGEQRYLIIGMTRNAARVVVIFVDRSEPAVEIIHIISARKAVAYEESIAAWTIATYPNCRQGMVGKYYRPLKSQISFRIDNDVLAWLRSKGQGHLSLWRVRTQPKLRGRRPARPGPEGTPATSLPHLAELRFGDRGRYSS